MKRILSLLLIAVMLFTFAGCAPKSEYEKVLAQKTSLEKKNAAITLEGTRLKKRIEVLLKDVKTLKASLKTAESNANALKRELDKAKAQLKKLSQ